MRLTVLEERDDNLQSPQKKSTNTFCLPHQLNQKTKIAAPTIRGKRRREGI